MTAKRDFKRRVRQRQVRTGESYMTARRHALAGRPGSGPMPDPAGQTPPGEAETLAGKVIEVPGDAVGVAPNGTPPSDAETLAGKLEAPADAAAAAPHDTQSGDAEELVDTVVGAPPGNVAGARRDTPPGDAETLAGKLVGPPAPAGTAGDVAGKSPGAAAERPAASIPVVELIDVSDEARRLGLVCRVLMFPALAERVPPARVLRCLRDILVATVEGPTAAPLANLALTGRKPGPRKYPAFSYPELGQFLQRARAGLGGLFDDGAMLAFHVAEGDGIAPILCTLSAQNTALELSAIDGDLPAQWEVITEWLSPSSAERPPDPSRDLAAFLASLPRPPLFLIHQRQRYEITKDEFVIGRSRATADLVINGAMISRRHAAVVRRAGAYYLQDLGSQSGIIYKGMRIDNKRIDEGDVFELGAHELRFTFRVD